MLLPLLFQHGVHIILDFTVRICPNLEHGLGELTTHWNKEPISYQMNIGKSTSNGLLRLRGEEVANSAVNIGDPDIAGWGVSKPEHE